MANPLSDPSFFPVMVWCQDPALAPQYKALGINTFFALWEGPTEEQLAQLEQHGLYVVCGQNQVGLAHCDDTTIIAWMHGDEPDNRQGDSGSAVPLEKILNDYAAIKRNDPTRPVVVNFGQGVANDEFPGRAISPDQYPAYAHGADIVSYDVYPVANIKVPGGFKPHGENYLWYVARGIDRLRQWTDHKKPVWNCIECTQIHNPPAKATPAQVRAEVWMSLVHGSGGICWFVHEFKPTQSAARLLDDEEMKQAVGNINREIAALAPVLNSPSLNEVVTVAGSTPGVPIDVMVKKHGDLLYIFAVCMRNQSTTGTFTLKNIKKADLTVLGENRTLKCQNHTFTDNFKEYDVHRYTLPLR